jgi:tRNA-splicing ligase RtcB
VQILGARAIQVVHNHHNFAWRERHFGQDLIVVRKGATPAFPGQRGFVGGSMGDDAVILQGAEKASDQELQQRALYSTVHGAGRVMSRSKAKGSRPKKGVQRHKGLITRQMMHEWIRDAGVILRGGDVDEAPHVYRRLDEVIAAQGATIEVLHRLSPLIVVMAGAKTFDPYRD